MPHLLTPKQIIKRVKELEGERGNWETHWQEIADFMLPRKNDIVTDREPGSKRNIQIVDSTGLQALDTLAAALQSMLTNPNQIWFTLTTGIRELDELDPVRKYTQDVAREMTNLQNNSNFQNEIHEYYLDLVGFGVGVMTLEEEDEFVVRYKTHFIREIFIKENHMGLIDQVYRKYKMNAENIIREFGKENVTKRITDAFEKDNQKEFEIIQAVYPSQIVNPSLTAKSFRSQHILVEGLHTLLEKGFNEFPFIVSRWAKSSGEKYGRSPAMNALPEVKTINAMKTTVIKGAQKVVDPALQMPDDGFIMPIRLRPGSLNFFRSGSADRIEPIFNDTRIDFGFDVMREQRDRIRECFFVDQLQLNEGPQATAEEIIQRTQDRNRILAPLVGRQRFEFLRPLIDRQFNIMNRRGLLPQPPPELEGIVLDVQYNSMIAQAQKVNEAQGIIKTMQLASVFAQSAPEVLDNFDHDQAAITVAKLFNFPQEIIRNRDEVADIREARAAAQQQQADAENAARQADIVAKAGPSVVQSQQLALQQ